MADTTPADPSQTTDGELRHTLSFEERVVAAEQHLSKLTELCSAAQVALNSLLEQQKQTASSLTEAQAKLAEIAGVATQALAAKTQITDLQAVIATKSDHIQNAQDHADRVRADLDRALTSATQQLTAAEGERDRAKAAAAGAGTVLEELRVLKSSVDSDSAAIASARKISEQSAEQAKGLADKSSTVEARIAVYEGRLEELCAKCDAQLAKIDSLLPGATSAGLAHAFDQRRKTFLRPHSIWQGLFVTSVVAVVVLTGSALYHVLTSGAPPTYDELIRLWLSRLPVVGALVWMALYASREAALAKRLEEDYGYKSAIASCFEGFRKQMSDIAAGSPPDSPVTRLCTNTLTAIASPPGRIYDKHKLTVSPTDEIKNAAGIFKNDVKAAQG